MAIAHRLGRLEIGDISLVVAVSSPHRADAFAACKYAVDRIKQVVPIWKKEFFEDGEVWVGSEGGAPLSWGWVGGSSLTRTPHRMASVGIRRLSNEGNGDD